MLLPRRWQLSQRAFLHDKKVLFFGPHQKKNSVFCKDFETFFSSTHLRVVVLAPTRSLERIRTWLSWEAPFLLSCEVTLNTVWPGLLREAIRANKTLSGVADKRAEY